MTVTRGADALAQDHRSRRAQGRDSLTQACSPTLATTANETESEAGGCVHGSWSASALGSTMRGSDRGRVESTDFVVDEREPGTVVACEGGALEESQPVDERSEGEEPVELRLGSRCAFCCCRLRWSGRCGRCVCVCVRVSVHLYIYACVCACWRTSGQEQTRAHVAIASRTAQGARRCATRR
jgi:hypothetical protein